MNTLSKIDQTKPGKKVKKKKAAKSPNEKEVAILTARRHMYSAYYQVAFTRFK